MARETQQRRRWKNRDKCSNFACQWEQLDAKRAGHTRARAGIKSWNELWLGERSPCGENRLSPTQQQAIEQSGLKLASSLKSHSILMAICFHCCELNYAVQSVLAIKQKPLGRSDESTSPRWNDTQYLVPNSIMQSINYIIDWINENLGTA